MSLPPRLISFFNRLKQWLTKHKLSQSTEQELTVTELPIDKDRVKGINCDVIHENDTERELYIDKDRINGVNCDVIHEHDCIVIRPHAGGKHAYVTLGGSQWHEASAEQSGWIAGPNTYITGSLNLELKEDRVVSVYAISYGSDGQKIYLRQLGGLNNKNPELDFSFALHPESIRFDVALYLSSPTPYDTVTVTLWSLMNKVHKR